MAGISSKALNGLPENKVNYNGKENQRKEFSDGSSLNWYDYGARMFNAQIGRWNHLDPLAERSVSSSPYLFADNIPTTKIDINGEYAVSVHYDITFKALLKLGYSKKQADLIAHYSSTYADHPSPNVQFADAILHFKDNSRTAYRSGLGIDYPKTRNSQDEENSMWHSMMSDKEAKDGMTETESLQRGLLFGWTSIFEYAEGENDSKIGSLGQGLHALQDAIAHDGVRSKDHLGHNTSSAKKLLNDMYGNTSEASNLTRSAIIVVDVLRGTKGRVKDGDTLDLRGMSKEQLTKFLVALTNIGFLGTITNK